MLLQSDAELTQEVVVANMIGIVESFAQCRELRFISLDALLDHPSVKIVSVADSCVRFRGSSMSIELAGSIKDLCLVLEAYQNHWLIMSGWTDQRAVALPCGRMRTDTDVGQNHA